MYAGPYWHTEQGALPRVPDAGCVSHIREELAACISLPVQIASRSFEETVRVFADLQRRSSHLRRDPVFTLWSLSSALRCVRTVEAAIPLYAKKGQVTSATLPDA